MYIYISNNCNKLELMSLKMSNVVGYTWKFYPTSTHSSRGSNKNNNNNVYETGMGKILYFVD